MAFVREASVYLAKLAEETKRYDDVVEYMKKVAKMGVELTDQERNMLSIGYKHVVERLNVSWRYLSAMEEKEESLYLETIALIKEYRVKVEREICKTCQEIFSIINLIPASTLEASQFYQKMRGDHNGYLAEITTRNERFSFAADLSRNCEKEPETQTEFITFSQLICCIETAGVKKAGVSKMFKILSSSMADISDREKAVYFAKLAERTGCFHDVVEYMKDVAKMEVRLTEDEGILLSIGYRHVVKPLRASRRYLLAMEEKEESGSNIGYIKEYRKKVEGEMSHICREILPIIDKHLIPKAPSPGATLAYWTMRGDHYRYLAEIATGDEKESYADRSDKSYEGGKMAAGTMRPTDPAVLGLALNHSVLHYVILDLPDRAIEVAEKAIRDALSEETIAILQVLQDNINLWKQERSKN